MIIVNYFRKSDLKETEFIYFVKAPTTTIICEQNKIHLVRAEWPFTRIFIFTQFLPRQVGSMAAETVSWKGNLEPQLLYSLSEKQLETENPQA